MLGNARQTIVDADESTRPRLEGAGHKPHQDHITAEGTNSINHYSLVHKCIPMPQALKNSRCKGGSGETMGKTGETFGMTAGESQKQERSDRRSKIILGIATGCGELRGNRSNTADYRIPGISISTVKLQDARRQDNVTKLIEMFEKHEHKEQFLKDLSQKAGDQQVRRGITTITRRHEPHRDLRTLREFRKTSMS